MKTMLYIHILLLTASLASAQQGPRQDTMKVTNLKEIAVTARPPLVEQKPGKTTFNVQNSILASGGTVWDALRKVPGVQTNDNGQITANNKSMTVYIDGKPIQMTGENLSTYLSGLPADNLSKIEIMTTPPAKYDAQGGGIINILTKRSKQQGFNATASTGYTQATYGSYNAAATFNYRHDNLNVYGNYGYTQKKLWRQLDGYTIYQTPGTYSDWQINRYLVPLTKSHSYQLGADYNLSTNQVVGIRINGYNAAINTRGYALSSVYNNYKPAADSAIDTRNQRNTSTSNYSFNVNYSLKLDSAGKSLNIDLDYVPYNSNVRQSVNALTTFNDDKVHNNFNVSMPSSQQINIWSGKADLTYKAGARWNMESGVKFNSISSDNNFSFYNVATGTPVYDISKSNTFRYRENTAAAYTSISGDIGKWSLQAGLRGEYTQTKGHAIIIDSINRKNYLRLFPTVFVTYKQSDDHVFTFNYNIRIERPAYMQLNPARYYSSPYSYMQGNPALQPAINTNLELGYTFRQRYTATAGYARWKGLISNTTIQDNNSKTFYDTQQNLDNIEDYSLTLSANITPADWWEMNINVIGDYRKQHSMFTDGYFASDNFVLDAYLNQSFVISKSGGLKAEISAFYGSPINQGVYHVRRGGDLSFGISKSILKKQGTLKLAFGDIFYTTPYKLDIAYNQQRNGLVQKNDTRNVVLSFSYKFGRNIAASRKRQTASEEEKKRAN